jgi:hypothetical protein
MIIKVTTVPVIAKDNNPLGHRNNLVLLLCYMMDDQEIRICFTAGAEVLHRVQTGSGACPSSQSNKCRSFSLWK